MLVVVVDVGAGEVDGVVPSVDDEEDGVVVAVLGAGLEDGD